MNYKKTFNFLKSLPVKLNSFYKKKSKSVIKVNNKSKNKKDFDPVTNFDKSFEKYIRSLILKKFPIENIIVTQKGLRDALTEEIILNYEKNKS